MSWNPRRFALEMTRGNYPTTGMLWLTANAIDRINSAVQHGTVESTTEPFPSGWLVGLARPLDLETSDAAIFHINTGEDIRRTVMGVLDLCHGHYPEDEIALERRRAQTITYTNEVHLHTRTGKLLGRTHFGDGDKVSFLKSNGLPANPELVILSEADGAKVGAFIHVAWAIVNTPLEREVTATTVATQRISVGKKRKARNYDVSVIDIRPPVRRHSIPNGSDPVERDHRWTVRPHWRNQACGPERSLRRRIWIDGYIAGPEDKPLKYRPKVNVLR